MKGVFIMVDGLDGSGKGTIVTALKEHLEQQGKSVFDLREFWQLKNEIPTEQMLADYQVIISSEPTHSMIGKVIREEIIQENGREYSGLSTAHAFSLDREILYKKLIIPSLQSGKIIIQERGVITSLVYQPVQHEKLSLMEIINLPGNKLALKHAPHLLIVTVVDPDTSMKRLDNRSKKDNAIFEKIVFQRKIAERYQSDWLKKLFESHGSKVVYLDTNTDDISGTCNKAIQLVAEVLA
ncbi:deoxynucleoside kinase [Candidatus Woesearchaeota archaeon]|nr:deoxynucleoside kinase [Candidatus Woesearchaeota archaeon]